MRAIDLPVRIAHRLQGLVVGPRREPDDDDFVLILVLLRHGIEIFEYSCTPSVHTRPDTSTITAAVTRRAVDVTVATRDARYITGSAIAGDGDNLSFLRRQSDSAERLETIL